MPEPTEEELAAEEKRRQKRIRDNEKYLRQKERKQKIAEGLIVPGEPYQLVCQDVYKRQSPALNKARQIEHMGNVGVVGAGSVFTHQVFERPVFRQASARCV